MFSSIAQIVSLRTVLIVVASLTLVWHQLDQWVVVTGFASSLAATAVEHDGEEDSG